MSDDILCQALVFIVHLNPQLQPDLNKQTVTLLCDLIRKMNDTTICNNIPVALQWSSPPHAIVLVHYFLYVSIAASMFSALLTMVGKQWLNEHTPNIQGPAFKCGWNQQQKFNRFSTLLFCSAVQLPLAMLYIAVTTFIWAFHRYLGEIDTTISWVFFVAAFSVLVFILAIQVACSLR